MLLEEDRNRTCITKTDCKKSKSQKVEETDERGFYDDNELDDIDTFIHTSIQSMTDVNKIMNSHTLC